MKSYEDIAERVFEKGDEILKRRQKRTALIRKTSLIVSQICAVVLICFGIWKTGDMQISMNHDFPDTVITESESTADFSVTVPVSTSKNNDDNVIYASETVSVSEPNVESAAFSTESAPENIVLNTSVPDNISSAQLQTSVNSAETQRQLTKRTTFQMQTTLQTVVNTSEMPIQIQTTVCTTVQTENEGSIYMKKLTAFCTSAIVIAASATPIIGNAEYKIDESRFVKGEKAIFAQMESGELDVDINGNGEFDAFDGFMLHCYTFNKSELAHSRTQNYYIFDNETSARIDAIADYNGDGKVDNKDNNLLERYFIVSRKLKREHLDLTYYDPEYIVDENEQNPYNNAVYGYVMGLRENMKALLAGYDIVAEMYEDGTIDFDFNGNGQLDVGDVYTLNVFYNLYKDQNEAFYNIKYIENSYISEEEWNRCNEAQSHYPHTDEYYPILIGYHSRNDAIHYLLFYSSRYIVAHTELKSEYFTEEYYAERYGDNYYCPESLITSSIVRQAAENMGVQPGKIGNAEYKIDESRFAKGEKAIFAQMKSGELDVDINGDGVFDVMDGFTLYCYTFERPDYEYYREQHENPEVIDSIPVYTVDDDIQKRIKAIADYNGDGTVDSSDSTILIRYLFVSGNVRREHFEISYYDPEFTGFPTDVDPTDVELFNQYWYAYKTFSCAYQYPEQLCQNMQWLLAGYDIFAEMYETKGEDWSIDLDFNGNAQLDIGDVYVFYAYYAEQRIRDYENLHGYISDEEWNRCEEALSHYPSFWGLTLDNEYYFLHDLTHYIVGHIEMKPEYLTEEYYIKTYGDKYLPDDLIREVGGVYSAWVGNAAANLGIKPNQDAWIKYNVDDLNEIFVSYCRDVENGLCPAPDVNMDGVVDLNDYFVINTYMTELIAAKTADNSILPDEIWHNINENFDINRNCTTKDIYDILTIQMYVIKYTDTTDFDAAYKRYQESYGENSTLEIESLSYEKKVAILAEIESKTVYGDANCDGKVEIADATMILQFLTNKDEYQLSKQGMINADCCNTGDGVTAQDALALQMLDAGEIESLPVTIE